MSTGKRIAKRSIIGTRVCARKQDGLFYSGVICDVKTATLAGEANLYTVRFLTSRPATTQIYTSNDLVGPGFKSPAQFQLLPGQQVFVTHNGREVTGHIKKDPVSDGVLIELVTPNQNGATQTTEVRKRLDEVRLLESRKSARLMDSDTDFARLADMAGDRKKTSSIDVPGSHGATRKRRPDVISPEVDNMDECMAALVLMHLSCSPKSMRQDTRVDWDWETRDWPPKSSTPSPTSLGLTGTSPSSWNSYDDEGISLEEGDRKKRKSMRYYKCLWPGCGRTTLSCSDIEMHVRDAHFGNEFKLAPHEEEFYYTEVMADEMTSSPPTLSHRDMARPPYEDPEYIKQINKNYNMAKPITISTPPTNGSSDVNYFVSSFVKEPNSPTRKFRGETKKCRKVYGMENKDMWCTQCKWKKACTRFGD